METMNEEEFKEWNKQFEAEKRRAQPRVKMAELYEKEKHEYRQLCPACRPFGMALNSGPSYLKRCSKCNRSFS